MGAVGGALKDDGWPLGTAGPRFEELAGAARAGCVGCGVLGLRRCGAGALGGGGGGAIQNSELG